MDQIYISIQQAKRHVLLRIVECRDAITKAKPGSTENEVQTIQFPTG
jgi:hypothetical protein